MKRLLISITLTLITITLSAHSWHHDDISRQALFLTDKMAYELNLTDNQYEAAYEINYDYLCYLSGMICNNSSYDDVYGRAWKLRNRDFKIILLSSQYDRYKRLKYFYRPFECSRGRITIRVYDYYPERDFLYFGRPHFATVYRGGHGWRHYGTRSYYMGRAWHDASFCGMRDRYNRSGHYHHGGTHNHGRNHGSFRDRGCREYDDHGCYRGYRGGNNRGRISSTRRTVNDRSGNSDRSRFSEASKDRLPDNRFSPRDNKRGRSDDSSRRGRFTGGK